MKANLIDTHAHLYWDSFQEDLGEVVQRSIDNGVQTIINVGVDVDSSQKALELVQNPHSPISSLWAFSSIGLHPHEAFKYVDRTDESIQEHIQKLEQVRASSPEKVIAIGECGLDYFFHGNSDFTPTTLSIEQLKELQKKLLIAQVNLAKKLDLPLIIHCRDAWSDIFPPLSETKGLLHTFTGSSEDAKKALDMGYYLSFSCIVTYPKNEALREIIKTTPLDKILTETDCPFLPPQAIRGQRNEPANVLEVVKVIAQQKSLSIEQVGDQIIQNFKQLFQISL